MGSIKILVLVLVLLIAVAFVASPSGMDRVGALLGGINAWLGANMGGVAPPIFPGEKSAAIGLEPATPFSLRPDAALNITSGSVHINGFRGEIVVGSAWVSLSEASTGLNLTLPANGTVLSGLMLGNLSFSGIPFYISPNITATSGNISITGFYGSGSIDSGRLSLEGNVSSVRASIAGVSIEV